MVKDKIINQIQLQLELFYRLKPSEKKIMIYLFDIVQSRILNNEKDIKVNPKGKTIAKKTGYCEKTVENFSKHFRTNEIHKKALLIKRTSKNGRRHLNEYLFNEYMLCALFMLKYSGSLCNKSCQQMFITQFAESQEYGIGLLTGKYQKVRHVNAEKYGTITTYLNNILEEYKVPTNEVPTFKEMKETQRRNLEIIELNFSEPKITTQQRKYFISNYPLMVVKKGIDDINFYRRKGNIPKSDFGMLYSRIKYHNLDRRKYL